MILTNEDTLTSLNDDVSQVDIMVLISSYNYNNYDIVWITTGVEEVHKKVHECKKKGDGMPVYTIPIILFCDDTSGNRSKKWNKFIVWDLIIAGNQV